MRYASVCSGIEAPSVAWHPLGWQPVFFSEIEKFPSRVLAHHYPDVPNLGDMTRIDGAAWRGKVDVLIGGTPCQAFSVAGGRESLADDRGNLSLTFCELVHAIDPLCVVWENVPGVLSVEDNAFGCILAGLVGEDSGPFVSRSGTWPVAGMVVGPKRSAAWRVLDAQYFGLAQRRRRVFVVSFRTADGINPGAVLFEPESMRRDSAPSREAGAGVTQALTRRLGSSGPDDNSEQANHLIAAPHANVSPALKARDGKGPSSDGDGDGAILVPMIAHTLRGEGYNASEDGTGRGTPIVPVAFLPFDTTQITSAVNRSNPKYGDPCHTIGRGTAAPSIAYAIQERAVSENINAGPQGSGVNVDVGYTLEARNKVQSVAYQCHGSNVGPMGHLRAGNGNESGGVPFTQSSHGVRRLTPRECERLQGFSDDYTNIPGAKDGPRYKALGNSMAVPVIRWLGMRIDLVVAAREAVASA